MKLLAAIPGFFLLLSAAGTADDGVDACDLAAGHPSDPDHVGPGVATREVVAHIAIPACRAAVEREPGNPRFHYQLGRAIVYWADANNGDDSEGFAEVKAASDMGYRQAQFVLGLLHKRLGEVCAAEPLNKAAADQGLKSARLTYVDDVTAGQYDACGISASAEEMSAYLEGAKQQVSGYYEGMLLGSLERQLDEFKSPARFRR